MRFSLKRDGNAIYWVGDVYSILNSIITKRRTNNNLRNSKVIWSIYVNYKNKFPQQTCTCTHRIKKNVLRPDRNKLSRQNKSSDSFCLRASWSLICQLLIRFRAFFCRCCKGALNDFGETDWRQKLDERIENTYTNLH